MDIRPSEELAAFARSLYLAMGAGDAAAVEAFYSLDPHAVFADGQQYDMRLTFVLHRTDGAWKIVHSHASVGG